MERIIKTLNSLLFITFIFLSFKIIKEDIYIDLSNKEYLNNIFNFTFNYNNLFYNITNIKNVSNEINYTKINDKYISNTNLITSLKDGNVYIYLNMIVVNQVDDFNLVFKGEFNPFIFDGDYIESGSIIGEYYEPFYLYLIKGNEVFSYEEYLRNYF